MKNLKIAFVLISIAFLTSCSQTNTTENSETKSENAVQLTTYSFEVNGMTCTGCEQTVQKSVEALPGVTEVAASHIDSIAKVSFNINQTTAEQIASTIEKKGYKVSSFSESKE